MTVKKNKLKLPEKNHMTGEYREDIKIIKRKSCTGIL
jgi:hypothetical protein